MVIIPGRKIKQRGCRGHVVSRVVVESLTEKMTFEPRSGSGEGGSQGDTAGKSVPAKYGRLSKKASVNRME